MAPDALRAEAEEVARSLPGLNLKARAADAAHLGAAGRKRAGTGEQFWQYRHYSQEDTAQRIDRRARPAHQGRCRAHHDARQWASSIQGR